MEERIKRKSEREGGRKRVRENKPSLSDPMQKDFFSLQLRVYCDFAASILGICVRIFMVHSSYSDTEAPRTPTHFQVPKIPTLFWRAVIIPTAKREQ